MVDGAGRTMPPRTPGLPPTPQEAGLPAPAVEAPPSPVVTPPAGLHADTTDSTLTEGFLPSGYPRTDTSLISGEGFSPEVAEALMQLYSSSGAINGEIANAGDVEITNLDLREFSFPSETEFSAAARGINDIMLSDELGDQTSVVRILEGVTASFEKLQEQTGPEIFADGIDRSFVLAGLSGPLSAIRPGPKRDMSGSDSPAPKRDMSGSDSPAPKRDMSGSDRPAPQRNMSSFKGGQKDGDQIPDQIPREVPIPREIPERLEKVFLDSLPIDVNALVQWVLRQSYLENTAALAQHAEKVRFYNEVKKQIREELKRAREVLTASATLESGDALADGPFNTASIETQWTGQTSSKPIFDMTPEEIAAQQAEQQRQQDVRDAIERYNAELAKGKKQVDVPSGAPTSYDPASHKGSATENIEKFKQQFLTWYNNLSPEQRAAVDEQFRNGNFSLRCQGVDHDNWDADETRDKTYTFPPMGSDEGVQAYLDRVCADAAGQFERELDTVGGGTKPYDFKFTMTSPPMTGSTQVPDPASADLSGLSQEDRELLEANGYDVEARQLLSDASVNPAVGDGVVDTKGELEDYVKHLEEKLNSVGDDAQLANTDLQGQLQLQQQTIQMMSNISKMLHDTAMSIIRKIGG